MKTVLLVVVLLGVWGIGAVAQTPDQQPIVRAEIEAEEVSVGQPVILRVTVLVPTWMPSPPVFPSFELPNLILRLPERASGPVSETVNGETWSGVSRAYRLYPMVAGPFVLPAQSLRLTYADPETRDALTINVPVPQIRFVATVPEGAEGLDPLIVAESLTLSQNLAGVDGVLKQGDSLTRSVTAKIGGSSPLFLPPMLVPVDSAMLSAYPREPVVTESSDRGGLSGVRAEEVTYVARYGGTVRLPPVQLQWFNTNTGKVETAELEGMEVTVDAPAPPREPLLTRKQVVALGVLLAVLAILVWVIRRWVFPVVQRTMAAVQAAWLASEAHAARQVRAAIRSHDLREVTAAHRHWEERAAGSLAVGRAEFDAALLRIGAARYGGGGAASWRALGQAFAKQRAACRRLRKTRQRESALPPLNPF